MEGDAGYSTPPGCPKTLAGHAPFDGNVFWFSCCFVSVGRPLRVLDALPATRADQ